MKKLIIYVIFLSLILITSDNSIAKTQFANTITQMENSLFGMDYQNQNDTKRLERLEKAVYGEKVSGNITKRLSKLTQDLHADMLGQEIEPKRDTFNEEDDYNETSQKADSNVNYPIIDELENKVFNKTFKTMEVNKRLTNLEKKVFSKTYHDDLSARTDRLKITLLPKNNFNKPIDDTMLSQDSIDFSDFYKEQPLKTSSLDGNSDNIMGSMQEYNSQNKDSSSVDVDVVAPLAQLEKKILRRAYKNDEIPTRLVRLESKLFNTTFTQDDAQTRLDRISSAYQASKTSQKYDDNKFSQKMATAMQIGAFLLMILAVIL